MLEYGAIGILLCTLYFYSRYQFIQEKKERELMRIELKEVRDNFDKHRDDVIQKLFSINETAWSIIDRIDKHFNK